MLNGGRNVFIPISIFFLQKSNDGLMIFFIFHPGKMVYIQEISINLYF
jgi:hypothetical protein